MTKFELADSAIKIGLGALISAVSGFFIMYFTQKYEIKKENTNNLRKEIDHKKWLYVEFLTNSQTLVQNYHDSISDGKGMDYLSYLRIYNEVQVISGGDVRDCTSNILGLVQDFIFIKKDAEAKSSLSMKKVSINNALAEFQRVANNNLYR